MKASVSFLGTARPYDVRLIGLAIKDSSGKQILAPRGTILEKLGKWSQNGATKAWELGTALILGLDGTKGGAFELTNFSSKFKNHRVLLRGTVLGALVYDQPQFGFRVLSVFALVDGFLWSFLCRSEMDNRERLLPVTLFGMDDKTTGKSFDFIPDGKDFELGKFCEPKVGPADGEKSAGKPEAGQAKASAGTGDGSASLVNLAKLKKSPLQLPGMKKVHTAWFCVEHVVGPYLETVSESARTLIKIGDEILPLLDPATIATWTAQLGGVKADLETFEKRFFSGDDSVSGFGEALDWPEHTPKFNATRLAPDLIGEMVVGSRILPSIPDDIKLLFHSDLHVCGDTGGFLLASYLRGAIEDIGTFLEMLAEKC